MPSPASISWRHRLVAAYHRAPEHRARLRLLDWLRAILAVDTVRSELTPGVIMELDARDYVQREILRTGGYELTTLKRFDALLADARGFTDFGAHMGLYTLRAARALDSRGGRVFAIEPTVPNAQALLRNAHLSGLENIELCTAAVSDQAGILRMVAPHHDNSGGTRLGSATNLSSDTRKIALHVCVRPAGDLAAIIPPDCLDLVKLDVEGHEFRVLRSLFAGTSVRPRNLLVEYLPGIFGNPPEAELAEEIAWMKREGYEVLTVEGRPYDASVPLPDDNLWFRRK